MSYQQSMMVFSFCQFMANLEQSGTHVRDGWCLILNVSLITHFYLIKAVNRT